MLTEHQEFLLNHTYYNLKNFFGRDKLYQLTREEAREYDIPHPTKRQVQEWLKEQKVYQLHKTPKRSSIVKPVIQSKPDTYYQADLIAFNTKKDEGYRYCLTMIDGFSRKLFAVPLKQRTKQETQSAMLKIIHDNDLHPKIIQTDAGAEFVGLSIPNAKHIVIKVGSPYSNGIIERFNGTLKRLIYMNMEVQYGDSGIKRWVSDLPILVRAINDSHQTTIGMAPNKIDKDDPDQLKMVASNIKNVAIKRHGEGDLTTPLTVNTVVRLKLPKKITASYAVRNWTDKLYKIVEVRKSRLPYTRNTYKVAPFDGGEVLKKSYVYNDLQVVPHPV